MISLSCHKSGLNTTTVHVLFHEESFSIAHILVVQVEKNEKKSWIRREEAGGKDLRTARYAFILRVIVKCCCGTVRVYRHYVL
jgi:hypothetical protein